MSRGIPFRNAGNISLEIHLQVSTFTDLFSVVPDKVVLAPGEVWKMSNIIDASLTLLPTKCTDNIYRRDVLNRFQPS